MTVIVQTERLQLRRIDPEQDAMQMLALLNEPGYLRNIADRGVRNRAQARAFIVERVLASYERHGFGMYAIYFVRHQEYFFAQSTQFTRNLLIRC